MKDDQLIKLIENRWASSASIWDEIQKVTEANTKIYKGDCAWWNNARIPPTRPKVNSSRVFTNTEAVINALIANPPRPNVLPGRISPSAKELSSILEGYLNISYDKLNTKEVLRQGLRDLFLSRLIVLKPYWNHKTNDFDVKRVDPKKVRFSVKAKNEIESEFAIEEIDSTVAQLIAMFPDKEKDILSVTNLDAEQLLLQNPSCVYKEAWIGNDLFIKYKDLILYKGRNPYFDWDGLIATRDEMVTLEADDGVEYKDKIKSMKNAKLSDIGQLEEGMEDKTIQEYRKTDKEVSYEAYLFNYFDIPRKPYIFASVLGNENRPIGMTSFIEQATSLQEMVDRTVYQIFLNSEMVNGITKVDSGLTNLSKSDAQTLRYDANGVIFGKGVINGVGREFGQGLPSFIFSALEDYRKEIDNIMAASSAFRGEREGTETKAGRLALVEQSYQRLNELVQVVDYVSRELFGWWMQLMKVKYTEKHMVKQVGSDDALKIIEISQDDLEDGIEVRIIPGKTLPEDKNFRYQRAQTDVAAGYISPLKYLEEAGYQDPKQVAKEAFEFAQNPSGTLGIEQAPPQQPEMQPSIQQPPELAQMIGS